MRLLMFPILGSLLVCPQVFAAGIVCDGTPTFRVSLQQVIDGGSYTCEDARISNLTFTKSGLDLGITADSLFIISLVRFIGYGTPFVQMTFVEEGRQNTGYSLPPNSSSTFTVHYALDDTTPFVVRARNYGGVSTLGVPNPTGTGTISYSSVQCLTIPGDCVTVSVITPGFPFTTAQKFPLPVDGPVSITDTISMQGGVSGSTSIYLGWRDQIWGVPEPATIMTVFLGLVVVVIRNRYARALRTRSPLA